MQKGNKSHDTGDAHWYEIRIAGILDPSWEKRFDGFGMTYHETDAAADAETALCGLVPDQAALHGILMQIRDLNLTLVAVNRIQPKGETQ